MTSVEVGSADARTVLEAELEGFRAELRAYAYRMLGSAFDAEDAVQDALVRAWRHVDRFEGRAALRSWLYRIATNVCLDMIERRQRRALPADLGASGSPVEPLGAPLVEGAWVEPVANSWVTPVGADPAERAAISDSVRLAFVAALQVLPPRQRAALILREVLAWRPIEIADLLGTTVASVNSALQRARATLASDVPNVRQRSAASVSQSLLDRYVSAFEADDVDALVALLHEDATWTMPPFDRWFRGAVDIREWLERKPCTVSRFVSLGLNGGPGFAMYRATTTPGVHEAFGVQTLELRDGAIAAVHSFLDERLVPLFGLSPTLVD